MKRVSIQDVLQSPWYEGFNFERYALKKLTPPIPVENLNLPKGVRPSRPNSDVGKKRRKKKCNSSKKN